jgi:hypothetical protein
VQAEVRRVIEATKNGFAGPDLKAEWDALQERKTALLAKLDSADELSRDSRVSAPNRPHAGSRGHAHQQQ